MTPQPAEVVQLLGRARPGDPVTATAFGLRARLARLGRPGRVSAVHPGSRGEVDRYAGSVVGHLVVHSVDGAEDLADVVDDLERRSLTLVHHGSATGSDRRTLRALRSSTRRAIGVDPAAREELRALGFPSVGLLDPGVADEAFDDVEADDVTAENLARHPGPLLLGIGSLAPDRGVEVLLDAFADLVTHTHPSAVLSLCGPSPVWYHAHLHRYVTRRGLLACEIVDPTREGEVVARLDRADVMISLRPAGLDPYLRAAARRGVPIVAPSTCTTADLDPGLLAHIPATLGRSALTTALGDALDRPTRVPAEDRSPTAADDLLRALSLA